MLKKKYVLLVFVIILSSLCGCAQKKKETQTLPELVIGSSNFEPYNYLDEVDAPAGIDVELAKIACKRMGYTPVFRQIKESEKDTLLESGEIDCLWGCTSMEEQEENYNWAGPYMTSRHVIVVRKNSQIHTLKDLTGKKISVQIGSKQESIFLNAKNQKVPVFKNVYSLISIEDVFSAMRKGYTDACVGDEAALMEYISTSNEKYRVLNYSVFDDNLGVAFCKNCTSDVPKKLETAFRSMKKDGTIANILKKYDINVEKALGGI